MADQAQQLSDGQLREQTLRGAGFTDDEVNQWKGQTTDHLSNAGFSPKEIRGYWGQKAPDFSEVTNKVKENLAKAQGAEDGKKPNINVNHPVEAKNVSDAFWAGIEGSVSGLEYRAKLPDIELSQDASIGQTIAQTAGQFIGDLPAALAGMVSGGSLGTAVAGPAGTAPGAMGGAFAVPAFTRKLLIEKIKNGEIDTGKEFAHRLVQASWEGAKGFATGVAAELTGGASGGLAEAGAAKVGAGAFTKALANTSGRALGETAAVSTVASGLEGRFPDKKDIVNAAISIGGLHAVGFGLGSARGYVSDKIANTYANTGAMPNEIVEAAQNDPHLKGQLLSENPYIPNEAKRSFRPAPSLLEATTTAAEGQDYAANMENFSTEELNRFKDARRVDLSDGNTMLVNDNMNGHQIGVTNADGALIGRLDVGKYFGKKLIDWSAVRQEYQGQGIGTEMYKEAQRLGADLTDQPLHLSPGAKAIRDKLLKDVVTPIEAIPPEEPPAPPKNGGSGPPDEPTPNEAREEILSRIGKKKEPDKVSLATSAKNNFNDFYARNIDYTDVIKRVYKEYADAPVKENANLLMRLHNAVQNKFMSFKSVGTRDWKTGEVNGESFDNIMGDMQKDGVSLDDLRAYGIAARSLELRGRDIQQPGIRENDQVYLNENTHVEPYFQRLVDYKNRVLDYLGGSGRYSQESIGAMKRLNQQYISFKKILEPDPLTGEMPATTKAIKKIGDSELKLQDPIQSTLEDVDRMIRLAHETEAHNKFIDDATSWEDRDEVLRVSEDQSGPVKDGEIAKFDDGKRIKYDTKPEIADALKRMAGNNEAISVWSSLLKPFATMLRMGTIDNPLFGIRHSWRNQLTAPTLSQTNLAPFQAILYAPEYLMGRFGLTDAAKSYHDFHFDGGSIESVKNLKNNWIGDEIAKLDKEAPFLDKAWNNVKSVGDVTHQMIILNDNILRFAEYKRMLDKGASRKEAALGARDVLPDFQKAGMQRSALIQNTAFLNVHMQGQARMMEAFNKDWDNFKNVVSGEDRSEAAKSLALGYVAKNLAMFTVPSMLLAASQAGDDVLDDVNNWQKYAYWNFHTDNWRSANSLAEAMSVQSAYPSAVRQLKDGSWQVNDGHIWRVQKPFTNGILFSSMFEASMDAWKKHDPKSFMDFAKTLGGSMFAEPIPTAVTPILEQVTNKNFYTGRPIVRQSMENKLPEMQYDAYTSQTAKVVGKLLSYVPGVRDLGPESTKLSSPQVIDNYIHAWGGTLGRYAVDALDKGLEKAGVVPDPIKPVKRLDESPFVREFMIRYPTAHPQSVDDFLDRYKKSDQVYNSIRKLLAEGNPTEAFKLENRYKLNMDRLRGADRAIENWNSMIQKMTQAPDIDPVQKRQMIDMTMFNIISAAKEGNRLMDEFEKSAQNK